MGRYRIDTPDGQSFEIEGPDGATDEQLNDLVRQQLGNKFENSPIQQGPPTYEQQAMPEDALVRNGRVATELGRGFAQGAGDVLDHAADWTQSGLNTIGNFVGAGNVGDSINSLWGDGENDLAGSFGQPTPGYEGANSVGQFAGMAAATLPLAALPGGVMTQGAAGGALLSDKSTVGGVALDAGIGAAAGKAGELAMRGASRLVSPNVTDDVRTLIDNGVEPTSGQIAGSVPRGTPHAANSQLKRFEDVAASVPIAGAAVRGAQGRATESLNRAAINRALRPIGERLPAGSRVGHESVEFAGNRLSEAYNDVLPRLSGQIDNTFSTRVQAIRARANLPQEYDNLLDQAQSELGNAFQRAGPNGQFSGRTLRDTSERLGDLATGWQRSDDPYTRIVGDAAQQMRDQLHALARRQNPQYATRLRDIDRGYASLVRVERAARGTNDGVFTARQYDSAVRGSDGSARRRQSARGLALDQDLSGAASRVMGDTAAHGGSKDVNSLIALGVLGGRASTGDMSAIAGLGAVGAGSAAYTGMGQDLLRTLMTRQAGPTSQPLADLLRQGSRYAGIAAPAAIGGITNGTP